MVTELAFSKVRIRTYRVQHWKGKQNKILKKKLKETTMVSNFLYLKQKKEDLVVRNCQVIGACLT